VIHRQSERLKKLIGEVLDIVSSNEIAIDKKNLFVNDLLDEILLDYHLKHNGTKTKFEFNKETNDDIAPLDKFHFTTMLLNLFDNAIKYNPNEEKELTVTSRRDKQHNLQILIKDNGMGIKAENMKHIFDKFYRSNNVLTAHVKGLGLGLYYVKQIADAHHWSITVESTPGVGSLFTITIPNKNGLS
jgi:two-component system phosphate regulon sensor histidine kinase PhoR